MWVLAGNVLGTAAVAQQFHMWLAAPSGKSVGIPSSLHLRKSQVHCHVWCSCLPSLSGIPRSPFALVGKGGVAAPQLCFCCGFDPGRNPALVLSRNLWASVLVHVHNQHVRGSAASGFG